MSLQITDEGQEQEQAGDQQAAPPGTAADSTAGPAALSSSSGGGYQSVPPSSLWGPSAGVTTPSTGTDETEAATWQLGSVGNHSAEANSADATGSTDGALMGAKDAEGAAVEPDSHGVQELRSAGGAEHSPYSSDAPHRAAELPPAAAESSSDAYHAAPAVDESSAENRPDQPAAVEEQPGAAEEHVQQQSGAPFLNSCALRDPVSSMQLHRSVGRGSKADKAEPAGMVHPSKLTSPVCLMLIGIRQPLVQSQGFCYKTRRRGHFCS